MKTKLFWHTVRYAAFCRALIRCIAVTKNFVKPGRSWPQVKLYPKFGHYCLMPLAAEGGIFFGGCEFIRYDDRPLERKKSSIVCKHLREIVSVVTEQIQSQSR